MKKVQLFSALTVALLFLSGCFQVGTVIKLKPDGSGTVEETVLISEKVLAEMDSLMSGFAVEEGKKRKGKPQKLDLFDPSQLKVKAAGMGTGISYLSGKRISRKGFRGYRAIYSFKDINSLTLDQNPGKGLTGVGATGDERKSSDTVIFHFSQGPPARLTIRRPAVNTDDKPWQDEVNVEKSAETGPTANPELEGLAQMVEGFSFSMVLEPQGNIIETNATHRNGSKITLVDLDFAKILDKPEQLAQLKSFQGRSLEDAKEILKNIPGMKMDLNDELVVSFQ